MGLLSILNEKTVFGTVFFWGGRWDLNPQHLHPQCSALPIELHPPRTSRILSQADKEYKEILII